MAAVSTVVAFQTSAPLGTNSPGIYDDMALKAVVAGLAIAVVAAPVAYAAFEINGLSAPGLASWRWPAISALAVVFALLAWWVVRNVHRRFPYS